MAKRVNNQFLRIWKAKDDTGSSHQPPLSFLVGDGVDQLREGLLTYEDDQDDQDDQDD